MELDRIDHFVLTVKSLEATCEFYSRILGMGVVTFGDNRKALTFGAQKINLHEVGNEFSPRAADPRSGAGYICLIAKTPIYEIVEHLSAENVDI